MATTAIATACAAAVPPGAPPLLGQWAGDRLQLVIDAGGGRVQTDCASGLFAGPVVLTADGRFAAQGNLERYAPGGQAADAAPVQVPARYAGTVTNTGGLSLTITPADGSGAQAYSLQANARVKLIRCM